jgi:hypothetical protein
MMLALCARYQAWGEGAAQEVHPALHRRPARRSGCSGCELSRLQGVPQQPLVEGPPPFASGLGRGHRCEDAAADLPSHERQLGSAIAAYWRVTGPIVVEPGGDFQPLVGLVSHTVEDVEDSLGRSDSHHSDLSGCSDEARACSAAPPGSLRVAALVIPAEYSDVDGHVQHERHPEHQREATSGGERERGRTTVLIGPLRSRRRSPWRSSGASRSCRSVGTSASRP